MSTKQERIDVFKDTYSRCKSDPLLRSSIEASLEKTKVWYENEYPSYSPGRYSSTRIQVIGKRSFQAAMDLKREYPDAKVAVLNFANAFHPGGGVKNGSSAQEESLCRTSILYPVLESHDLMERYYCYHDRINDPKATDSLIYTEDVVIFKTDTDLPEMMAQSDWVKADVITCAAPDLRPCGNAYVELVGNGASLSASAQFGYHVRRAIHILTVAAASGADCLVLGAFGCGAFRNDPEVVSRAWKTAVQEFEGVFQAIEFAVYCTPGYDENYREFLKTFKR